MMNFKKARSMRKCHRAAPLGESPKGTTNTMVELDDAQIAQVSGGMSRESLMAWFDYMIMKRIARDIARSPG